MGDQWIMNEVTPVAHPIPRAVHVTGLSRSLLYELMKRGELAFIKVGRRRLIGHGDLQSLISRYRVAQEIAGPPSENDRPVVVPPG
jgi:excisionase family DNA binding protein